MQPSREEKRRIRRTESATVGEAKVEEEQRAALALKGVVDSRIKSREDRNRTVDKSELAC